MRYWLCLLILCSFCCGIFSQDNSAKFKHLTTANGLSLNWVRCIYKDDIGFMWFGTADGLNRYDGKLFKIYRPKTYNKKEIGDINVSALCKKSNSELWVGTDLGLYVYNYKKDELEPFTSITSPLISAIFQTKENVIWLGTNNGLIRYDQATNKQALYLHDPEDSESLTNNYINVLFEDSYSNMWIGTKGGLNVYDTRRGWFRRLKISGLPTKNHNNDILSICEDSKHRVWVGYSQDGLYYFDNTLSQNIQLTEFYDGFITTLIVDKRNRLWMGMSNEGGLARVELQTVGKGRTPEITMYKNDPMDNNSLSDNSIYCLYQDDIEDIWIGTYGQGINYYSERGKKFYAVKAGNSNRNIKHNSTNAIIDDGEKVYFGFDGGLNVLDKKTGTYKYYSHDPENSGSLSSSAVYSLFKDKRGNIWVGTWMGGLNLFIPKNETFKHYLPDGKPESISNANVFSINEDGRGYLWVGTIGGGLNRYDYKTDKFKCYKNNPNDSNSLNFNMVDYIYETHDKKLYVSVYNSLDEFDYEHENFIHHKHDYTDPKGDFGTITSIFEDSNNHIWLATNCGLEYFDNASGLFYPYTTKDGLPDNTIQAVLEDEHKNLWISTNKGITKFLNGADRPKTPVFYNYTQDDGLASNESKRRSACKAKDGKMYFGSSNGYTYFYPDSIQRNLQAPQVIITGFNFLHVVKGNENAYKNLDITLNQPDTVQISYRNADFSIQFAALNYLNPTNNLFKYMLEGYDKEWIEAGNQQIASYTNIHPGTYTFVVTASNNDNIWNPTPKKLIIIIRPPWWNTLIFKFVFISFIIGCILFIFRIRFKVLRKQKKQLEEKVRQRTNELVTMNNLLEQRQEEITLQNEELSNHRYRLEELVEQRTTEMEEAKEKAEESDKLKSAFLANMSHEIRTPMNAIVGFASLLGDNNLTTENIIAYIDIIKNNSKSLLVLIDDILDISLIEANQLVFSKQEFSVDEVLAELESFYQMKAKNQLDIQFIRSENLTIFNDPVRFRQICNNLLDNAIKYTDKGHIWFGYHIFANQVQFYVSDTGIGIDAVDCENIFNHFFKVEKENLKLYRGIGIGLSICKKMIELMGGRIWVESTKNVGSTFYFTLPVLPAKAKIDTPEILEIKSYKFDHLTILIAEDEPDNYYLLSSIIKQYNPQIIWAKNGQEAVDYFKGIDNHQHIVVLMDIKMPIMNGYEATTEIKKINSKIPIIAVTAYAQVSDKQAIKQGQFDGYISKPINSADLLEAISKLNVF